MRDITAKTVSLHKVSAIAVLRIGGTAFEMLKSNTVPEGNWQDIARTAASIGIKNAASFVPFSSPAAVEAFRLEFTLLAPGEASEGYQAAADCVLVITGEVKSIGRAEPAMEILAGVSTAVLTIFNLLQDKSEELEVVSIKLLDTLGGAVARDKIIRRSYKVAVLVCSDGVASGKKMDTAGQLAREILQQNNAEVVAFGQLGLQEGAIRKQLVQWIEEDVPFIMTLGGTGPGKADVVTSIVSSLIEKELPGIVAAMYQYGISRSPKGMLSSLVAGVAKESVLVTLPGSTSGLQEGLGAILPDIFSFRKMIKGASR